MGKEARYSTTWKKSYNFLVWCQYWVNNGSSIRLSCWKKNHPGIIHIEKNTDDLFKQYGTLPHQRQYDYFVKYEDGEGTFMTRKEEETWCKNKTVSGIDTEWTASVRKSTSDIFEE